MGWLDKVPGCGDLYIGGLYSLRRYDAVKEARISHVLSVIQWPIDEFLVRPYTHLQIEVDDVEDENLLLHFPITNIFIEEALANGGSVIVHCAMGKSRSATIVIAYMMKKLALSPQKALKQLRESRGVCEPNDGFWKQLQLYYDMGVPDQVEDHPMYQRWLYDHELSFSRKIGTAPTLKDIRFRDEFPGDAKTELELRCRKCSCKLASSNSFVEHKPREVAHDPNSNPVPPSACAHYFLEALSWMRPELEKGDLTGKLACPKCTAKVGQFAWQGLQCSCGDWVVPGISLLKTRVDQLKTKVQPATIPKTTPQVEAHSEQRNLGKQNL